MCSYVFSYNTKKKKGENAELLDGTDIAVLDNVVTPDLLSELKNIGVRIQESGKIKLSDRKSFTDINTPSDYDYNQKGVASYEGKSKDDNVRSRKNGSGYGTVGGRGGEVSTRALGTVLWGQLPDAKKTEGKMVVEKKSQVLRNSDEIDQFIKTYAEMALQYKEERPDIAGVYIKLSEDEMGHMSRLHEMVSNLIREYRSKNGDPLESMQAVYDYLHERQIEKSAEVLGLQNLYKR